MSTGRTVRIVLEAVTSGYEQGIRRAAGVTKELGDRAAQAEQGAAGTAQALGSAGSAASGYASGVDAAAAATETLSQRIQRSEQSLNSVAAVLAVGGAAALAFAGAAVKAHTDFDSAMSGVAAATRAPEKDMAKLREAAMQLGADTKFSAIEAAGGIEALGRAGVSTRDILGGGLKGSLDLAAAGNLQVADAAELASIAMTQFKLRGRDVPHVADLLAAGAGKAMGEVSDLGMALKQSGLVASQFGLSIEETVGGLSAFASAGLLGSDAGTSFKAMLLKLADPSKETKKTMAELGINAYNAQGQFIGLAGLAGELRDKLQHLSEAQRQQALAQIFGTDAIRAATILYNEGAEGIQRWTAAVDDNGYAAEQTRIQHDNLAGDLEKVGGAWDNLLIRMGSAANGPLRAAAQAVDGFLTALGNDEGAAQTLFVITAGLGAAALATAGLIKGVVAVNNFKQALDGLGLAGGKLGKLPGIIGKVAKASAFVGLAVAAWEGVRALAGVNEAAAKTGPELSRFAKNVSQGKTSLDALFRDTDGKALTSDLGGLIETSYDLKSALGLIDGNWFGPLNVDAGKAKDAIKAVGNELAEMDGIQAAAAFGHMRGEFQALGKDAAYMAQYFGPYLQKIRDELIAAGPAYAEYVNDAEKLADVASGKVPEGLVMTSEGLMTTTAAIEAQLPYVDHLGNKYEAGESAATKLAAAQEKAADKAREQAEALHGVVDAINDYYDAVLSASDAAIDYEAAVDDASEALEKNGQNLDISTEKGRENRKALDNIAKSGKGLAESMRASGADIESVGGAMQRAHDDFVSTAQAMGMSAEEAEDLARSYGLIPESVTTLMRLEQAGADPLALAEAYAELMKLPPDMQKRIRVDHPELVKAAEQAWLLDRNLNGIPDNTEVIVTAPGLPNTGASVQDLNESLDALPAETQTQVSAPGAVQAENDALNLLNALLGLPQQTSPQVTTEGAPAAVAAAGTVLAALLGLPEVTTPVVGIAGVAAVVAGAAAAKGALGAIPKVTTPGLGIAGVGTVVAGAAAAKGALGSIPKLTTPGLAITGVGAVVAGAAAARGALGSIPRHVGVSITASSNVGSVVAGAAAALASINGRVATTTIRTVRTETALATGGHVGHAAAALGFAAGGSPRRRSWPNGGVVEGPGTTISDSIPAMLSRREFVQRAAAVAYYGTDVMYALNSMRIPKERLVGYSQGGTPSRTEPPRFVPTSSIHHATPVHVTAQTVDVSQIRQAVADGLAQARIVMDGRVIDARIETANSATARRFVRGA